MRRAATPSARRTAPAALRRILSSKAGRIRIAGASEHVQRVIRVCHLDEFFGVDASVEEATAKLNSE